MELRASFEELIGEIYESSPEFSKLDFDLNFKRLYEKHRALFQQVEETYQAADDKRAFVKEAASYIPDYIERNVLGTLSKRKRESKVMDLNMMMVTYILPLMNYSRQEGCEKIASEFVYIWNKKMGSKIGNATYEDISAGFKKRLCYITTAVCEGLGKPDDCYELELLRNYRDEYLLSTSEGKALVSEYYNVAPTIVKRMNRTECSEQLFRQIYDDYLTPCIRLIEEKEFVSCKEVYTDMVHTLEKKYLYS